MYARILHLYGCNTAIHFVRVSKKGPDQGVSGVSVVGSLQMQGRSSVCLYLTLSLPIFWQFCSLSATFILTARGIRESKAYKFSKILIFLDFLSMTFDKYPKFEVPQ